MVNFDPHARIELDYKRRDVVNGMVKEAIDLIENDRPNAAKRLLETILEFGPEKRMREMEDDKCSHA